MSDPGWSNDWWGRDPIEMVEMVAHDDGSDEAERQAMTPKTLTRETIGRLRGTIKAGDNYHDYEVDVLCDLAIAGLEARERELEAFCPKCGESIPVGFSKSEVLEMLDEIPPAPRDTDPGREEDLPTAADVRGIIPLDPSPVAPASEWVERVVELRDEKIHALRLELTRNDEEIARLGRINSAMDREASDWEGVVQTRDARIAELEKREGELRRALEAIRDTTDANPRERAIVMAKIACAALSPEAKTGGEGS